MQFVGIESVVFGTSDLPAAGKFFLKKFADWGLKTVKNGRSVFGYKILFAMDRDRQPRRRPGRGCERPRHRRR